MLKVKGGWGKKKPVKPKDLPSLSSDEDHSNPTPLVDVPIISTTPVVSPAEPPAKKEKKLRQLTLKEEDDMAEWLKMNPCLYNKKLETYRNTNMKKRLWEEKAAEFSNVDVDVEYLLSWYKSMRTRYGKLSKLPTGSGAQELTERDAGILRKFAWLKSHISRQRGRQLGGVSIKNQFDLLIIDFL